MSDESLEAPEADLPTPAFGWSDMWASPEEDPRTEDGPTDERSLLLRYLPTTG